MPSLHSIPPLHYGDLAELGLAGWTPAGFVRWSFEIINVTTGLPWFFTIVFGTILWRVIQLPAALQAMRGSHQMQMIKPELDKLQGQIVKAEGHTKKGMYAQRMKNARDSVGFRPFATFGSSIVQVVIQFSLFLGLIIASSLECT